MARHQIIHHHNSATRNLIIRNIDPSIVLSLIYLEMNHIQNLILSDIKIKNKAYIAYVNSFFYLIFILLSLVMDYQSCIVMAFMINFFS